MKKLAKPLTLIILVIVILLNVFMIQSINKVQASTPTPCADGYMACLNGGGEIDECWAGYCACLEARYGSGCDELE